MSKLDIGLDVRRMTTGATKLDTYYIETEEKYVHEIFSSNYVDAEDKKGIEIFVLEREGDEYKILPIELRQDPDVVHIVPLKHEYAVICFYTVW